MKDSPNLDLLRSIAVLLVVVEHILLAMKIQYIGSWNIAWIGVVGVFMFFVHTSLVLMWSLERRPHALDFYIRRVFRIYPLAITAILVTVLLHIPTMQNPDGATYFQTRGIGNVVSNLLLMQNLGWNGNILGVMWTLPLEMDMYLLLPFLFFFIRNNFVVWPLAMIWGFTVAYDRESFLPEISTFLVCVPYFLAGVIAYVLFSKVKPRLPAWLMPVTVLALFCGFMVTPSWRNGWWFTLALGLTLPLFRSLKAKWIVVASHHIAKYSYGIYLIHPFCVVLGINVLQSYNIVLRICVILASLILLVVPAYHFLEKPMIDLGARFAGRLEIKYGEAVHAG